jgi:uncharacterized protein involved in response to NO
MATMAKLRAYRGPAIFSYGFRPFFLFGAIYSGGIILIWLAVFAGNADLPTAFAPRDWHVHEMLFGYVSAIIGGFVLTAVPNWTDRLPIQGLPLAALFLCWLAGRIAVCTSGTIGWAPAAIIDTAFLLLLAAAAAREIIAGRKWGNLTLVVMIGLFAVVNAAFHVEAHFAGIAEYSTRAGIALAITLIGLIGGRIIPSFTSNWLARLRPGRLPVPFGRFDAITMSVSAVALVVWIVAPEGPLVAALLCAAGVLQLARLARWTGYRTLSDRLVLILHIAYLFVPVGYFLSAAAAFGLNASSAGIHAWSAGAVGTMTIAVMSRASLGHTGRQLVASPATQCLYAAIVVAALTRISAALEPGLMPLLLIIAGVAWAVAFLGFATVYGQALCTARAMKISGRD